MSTAKPRTSNCIVRVHRNSAHDGYGLTQIGTSKKRHHQCGARCQPFKTVIFMMTPSSRKRNRVGKHCEGSAAAAGRMSHTLASHCPDFLSASQSCVTAECPAAALFR